MRCQRCNGLTRIPHTRVVEGGDAVMRVRECLDQACGWEFVTDERPVATAQRPVSVRAIKRQAAKRH